MFEVFVVLLLLSILAMTVGIFSWTFLSWFREQVLDSPQVQETRRVIDTVDTPFKIIRIALTIITVVGLAYSFWERICPSTFNQTNKQSSQQFRETPGKSPSSLEDAVPRSKPKSYLDTVKGLPYSGAKQAIVVNADGSVLLQFTGTLEEMNPSTYRDFEWHDPKEFSRSNPLHVKLNESSKYCLTLPHDTPRAMLLEIAHWFQLASTLDQNGDPVGRDENGSLHRVATFILVSGSRCDDVILSAFAAIHHMEDFRCPSARRITDEGVLKFASSTSLRLLSLHDNRQISKKTISELKEKRKNDEQLKKLGNEMLTVGVTPDEAITLNKF